MSWIWRKSESHHQRTHSSPHPFFSSALTSLRRSSAKILRKVAFSVEEIEQKRIAIPNGWKWDDRFDAETRAVELSDAEATALKEQSRQLDRELNIPRQILVLIQKIDAMQDMILSKARKGANAAPFFLFDNCPALLRQYSPPHT